MKKLVLLTGATGFVGRHILKVLLDKGCDVRVIVRSPKKIAEEDSRRIDSVILTDNLFLESDQFLLKAFAGVDTVIHAAWYVKHQDYLTSDVNLECVQGTLNIARVAASTGIKRFVGIGTCLEYRLTDQGISVDDKLEPKFLYAACKASVFLILEQIFKNQIDFLWCRIFYLYGEGEGESRLFPYIRQKLLEKQPVHLTDGSQIRDYLDVKIASQDIVRLALGKRAGVFNICSGVGKTVREIALEIAVPFGLAELLKFGEVPLKKDDPKIIVGIKNY
jgi:nucleoside-diphosphate-sugar epimerase